MNIKTRYRDISCEELDLVHPQVGLDGWADDWENDMRGKPIVIETGPVKPEWDRKGEEPCPGPWYSVVDGAPPGSLVCPHIAEIGD